MMISRCKNTLWLWYRTFLAPRSRLMRLANQAASFAIIAGVTGLAVLYMLAGGLETWLAKTHLGSEPTLLFQTQDLQIDALQLPYALRALKIEAIHPILSRDVIVAVQPTQTYQISSLIGFVEGSSSLQRLPEAYQIACQLLSQPVAQGVKPIVLGAALVRKLNVTLGSAITLMDFQSFLAQTYKPQVYQLVGIVETGTGADSYQVFLDASTASAFLGEEATTEAQGIAVWLRFPLRLVCLPNQMIKEGYLCKDWREKHLLLKTLAQFCYASIAFLWSLLVGLCSLQLLGLQFLGRTLNKELFLLLRQLGLASRFWNGLQILHQGLLLLFSTTLGGSLGMLLAYLTCLGLAFLGYPSFPIATTQIYDMWRSLFIGFALPLWGLSALLTWFKKSPH